MQKKLVQINTVCTGSIGRIMKEIQKRAELSGFQTISFVGRRKVYTEYPCEKFGNGISFWIHVIINTAFDKQGYGSYFDTRKLIKRLRKENPDVIHLHNLHGYYLYLPSLIKYLKNEFKGQLFWTFHDCWPFTGHCPYFTMVNCDRWRRECFACPNKKEYPISWFFDSSRSNYYQKKDWFSDFQNLTIIVPSEWMKALVQSSFMGKYPINVVSNGIDLEIFRYQKKEGIRNKYGISENKKVLLGIADVWSKRKGIDDFIQLAKVLPEEYEIVLVGVSKRTMKQLPQNIIGVPHTENVQELVALYSEAFIFVNPSLEESFSVVTIEAMACGTPVIALDTSAVKELVNDETGVVLHSHASQDYLDAIEKIASRGVKREEIAVYARKYSVDVVMQKMIELYEKI